MGRAIQLAHHVRDSYGIQLRPYQIEAVSRCLRSNTLLHLDMGLGKSLCAATAARGVRAALFIIPKVARAVWLKEIPRGMGVNAIVELEGKKKLRAVRRVLRDGVVVHEEQLEGRIDSPVCLVTHECVGSWADTVRDGPINMIVNRYEAPPVELPTFWDIVVVDESHRYGERNSKRAIGLSKFASHATRIVLLSGTPDLGGVHRLWFQLHLLVGSAFYSHFDFICRYAGAVQTDYGWRPTVATNTDELARRVQPWVLSYRQDDVLSSLPSHTRDRVIVPLTGALAKKLGARLESARKELQKLLASRSERTSFFLPGEVVEARLACAEAKVDAVVQFAEELLHQGERVVIWAWHRNICAQLAERLQQRGLQHHVLTGAVSNSQVVDRTIERWSSTTAVLIATIAKLGEGEDRLVAARWQLFIEIDWLPQSVRQAERRLVRLSQTQPVNTRFFELELPFERSLMDRVLTRAEDTDAVFGGSSAIDVGELFGVRRTGDSGEVLRRLSERLG